MISDQSLILTTKSSSPQLILQAVNNMLYLIHWNACAYYAISEYEGIGSNNFVYDGQVTIQTFTFAKCN